MKHKILITTLAIGLIGCSHQSKLETSFSKYANRMANVLDVKPAALITPVLSSPDDKLPRKVNLNKPDQETINLITLSKLNQCGLSPIIAERNTSLGKTQLPSTRLLWEMQFQKQLTYCTEQPLDDATKRIVVDILKRKVLFWDSQWGKFIQTSDPIRQSFQQNMSLVDGDNDGLVDTVAAFKFLNSIYSNHGAHQEHESSNELERHIQNIDKYKLPASAWRTQEYVTSNLNRLTAWLKHHVDLETCSQNKRFGEKAKYLRNVFELFFVGEIQPNTSKLNSYLYEINPIIKELVTSKGIDAKFTTWVLNKMDEERYKKAMQLHIEYWQAFFEACEFSPGR